MAFTASVERLRALDFFSLVEAEGTKVVACICLKGFSEIVDLFLVVRREGNLHKMLLGVSTLEVKRKQSPSKGILVV